MMLFKIPLDYITKDLLEERLNKDIRLNKNFHTSDPIATINIILPHKQPTEEAQLVLEEKDTQHILDNLKLIILAMPRKSSKITINFPDGIEFSSQASKDFTDSLSHNGISIKSSALNPLQANNTPEFTPLSFENFGDPYFNLTNELENKPHAPSLYNSENGFDPFLPLPPTSQLPTTTINPLDLFPFSSFGSWFLKQAPASLSQTNTASVEETPSKNTRIKYRDRSVFQFDAPFNNKTKKKTCQEYADEAYRLHEALKQSMDARDKQSYEQEFETCKNDIKALYRSEKIPIITAETPTEEIFFNKMIKTVHVRILGRNAATRSRASRKHANNHLEKALNVSRLRNKQLKKEIHNLSDEIRKLKAQVHQVHQVRFFHDPRNPCIPQEPSHQPESMESDLFSIPTL